jgi:hypothetical protein
MHRFAELGTIGSPKVDGHERDVRPYLPTTVTHRNQHKVLYVQQDLVQIPWNQ